MSQNYAASAQSSKSVVPNNSQLLAQESFSPNQEQSVQASIARDLHDSIGHTLTALSLHLELSGKGDDYFLEGKETLSTLCGKLKEDIADCLPARKNDMHIEELVAHLIAEMAPTSTHHLQSSVPATYLPSSVLRQIELIAREAINNYVKYARQSTLRVNINKVRQNLQITIADDGQGFEPESSSSKSFGIQGMKERAALVGGTIMISSKPGAGTSIVLSLPIESMIHADCNITYTQELKEQINFMLSSAIGLHIITFEDQLSLLASSSPANRAAFITDAGATIDTMLRQVRSVVKTLRSV